MSQQARQNLAPTNSDGASKDSKRKMTQAIIDEEENAKKNKKGDAYDFLEDDDDFEEFEIAGEAGDDEMMVDILPALGRYESEKKQWQEDWDDEEADEDFAKQLRAQIKK